MKVKTQKDYVQEGGQMCPFCGSHNVESESLQADGAFAWAEVTCHECEESWTDQWKLTGFNPTRI